MNYDNKIKELKIQLPEAKAPVGSYVATKISDNLLFISGQLGIMPDGSTPDTIEGQADQVFSNIVSILLFCSSSASSDALALKASLVDILITFGSKPNKR